MLGLNQQSHTPFSPLRASSEEDETGAVDAGGLLLLLGVTEAGALTGELDTSVEGKDFKIEIRGASRNKSL